MSNTFTVPDYARENNMTITRARRAVVRMQVEGKVRSVGIIDTGRRGKKPEGFEYVGGVA